jgi:VCBS repeat protein
MFLRAISSPVRKAGVVTSLMAPACGVLFLIQCAALETTAGEPKTSTPADMGPYYGFKPVEVYKLEPRSSNLLTGDFNNDGLTDLALFDNSHARIDLLLQRRRPEEPTVEPGLSSVNDVKGDSRFDHKTIALDKQLASMAIGDFNGDGRTDIACLGVPDRLIIYFQPASGEWNDHTMVRVPDVPPTQWIMAAGDLNGDGKDDLVILGRQQTYVFLQQPKGGLAAPTILMNTSEKLALAQVVDLDGDGRKDLCYVAGEGQDRTLCARLQDSSGRLGPELQFEVDRPRAVAYAQLNGSAARQVLTIDGQTGRLRILQLKLPAKHDAEPAGRLVQTGFGRQDSDSSRDCALGDVDGDGLTDLVVTDPDGAAVILFRQRKGEGLDPGQTFPSFAGDVQVRIAPLGKGGAPAVVVLSTKEKSIGISRFQNGRLTFPEALPIPDDEPILLEVADLNGDKQPEIVFVSRLRQSRSTDYVLHALERSKEGKWKPYTFGPTKTSQIALDSSTTPTALVKFDATRNGRASFLLFQGTDRSPIVLAGKADGSLTALPGDGGLRLGNVGAGAVFATDEPVSRDAKSSARESEVSASHDSVPTILVAQENFARKLQPGKDQEWRVVDQYNASEPSARIVGAALINLDGKPGREVVLIDTGIRKIRVLRREGDLYRPWKEIELGAFPYESLRVADLNGDGRPDLLLIGRGRFAVLYAGKVVPEMTEVGTFETKLKKTFFSDVVAGDLNGKGRPDLALTDTESHNVEILYLDAKHQPHHAFHFKVFEDKSFQGHEGGTEPRESAIADVTGDGRADLILLTHDRVLVYPQDAGK